MAGPLAAAVRAPSLLAGIIDPPPLTPHAEKLDNDNPGVQAWVVPACACGVGKEGAMRLDVVICLARLLAEPRVWAA